MSFKPKNEYKQVAYLNQKGKYKKYLRTRFRAREPNPEEYSHEKHRQADTPPESLLLYSISL